MATYKCKMCGGLLEIKEGQTVVTCEFCGTAQTVPHFDNEKKATFFRRANDLRLKCEFDKASGVYETIVTEFPNEAEAYWGLVLCKYGIEYVDDPKTHKKIPTCHRTQFSSIFEDHDYLSAVKYADAVAREIYKSEANAISKLQSAILEISSKEDPFDVFICYKETDERGGRTADSVLAQDIYDELTSAGYKVFFARRTLERKLGSEYEPYIFAALHSAKVMLHVTTSKNNSDSVWVRNEWARYLSLITEGQKKTLIPCYKGINAYDLPEEMKNLQAQDMSKIGAMQDLIYGIKKVIKPAGRVVTHEVEKEESFASDTGYDGLIRKGYTYLKNSKLEQAQRCFDKAVEATELCGDAYLGMVLCEYELESLEELLAQSDLSILENENFKLAREFANKSCNATLDKVEKAIIDNEKKGRYNQAKSALDAGRFDAAIEGFKELGDFEDSPEQIKECIYQKGQMYFGYISDIRSLGYCDDAIACFEEVISYKDSKAMIEKANSLRAKITEEYKASCIERYLIALPKDVTLLTLGELVKSVKANRDRVFNPSFSEFDNARAEAEAGAIKFFNEKCPALIQSFNTLDECSKLTGLCSSIEKDGNLKSVHELIKQREHEIKEQIRVLKKKRRKKGAIITAITCGALAVAVATFFGIKAIVDENNRKTTYASANAAMESGNYDDAISYYESLGNYGESQKKIKVCNGLKELKTSMTSKSEADMIKGIKTIVSAGEKVDISYETENNVNIKRLPGGNSGNKTETIDTVDFTLYQPTWSGYTFLNWNSDSLSYKNERTYLGAMSNWSLNAYTITYNLDGGINDSRNPATYTVESNTFDLYAASKKGYTFLGWYESEDKVTSIQKGTFRDYELTAHWQANNYVITLNPNSGTVNPTSIDVVFDSQYSLPTPTRDFYGFDGWFDSNNHKWTDGTYTTDDNVTLIAKWTPTAYTITYVLNDGTNDAKNPSSYTVEDNVTLYDASRTGYTFQGWFDSAHNKIESIPVGSHGPITLTAEWQINVYNYSFVNYDGSELQSGTAEYGSSVTYTGATPTKPATAQYTYTFSGWDKDTTFIEDNTTFTAQFNSTVNKYTITWKNWDGTILDTESVEYGATPSYKGSEPIKASDETYAYIFAGWTPTIESVTGDATYVATFTKESMYQYFLTSGKASISGVTGSDLTVYNIPSSINGYPVVEVRTNAFKNCSVAEEITVPNSVNFIQKGAFSGCSSLKSITLPFVGCQRINADAIDNNQAQADYIFGYVFGDTEYTNSTLVTTSSIDYYLPSGLTSVTINNTGTMTIIPAYGFEYNKIITDVTIKGNIYGLAYEALEFCKSLKSFDCSDSQVEIIANSVFDDCISLETVILREGITSIGDSAFADCQSLKEITIPDSVTSMGQGIFRGCTSLERMTVPFVGSVSPISSDATPTKVLLGYMFDNATPGTPTTSEYEVIYQQAENPGGANPTEKAFRVPVSLNEITITGPEIGYGALSGTSLEKVTITNNSLDYIQDYAFYACSNLETINLDHVLTVGRFAFKSCTSLQYVNLTSIVNIYWYAFSNCTSLEWLVLGSNLSSIGQSAFNDTNFTYVYYLGNSSTKDQINETGGAGYMNIKGRLVYYSETGPGGWHYVDGIPTLW